MNEIMVSIICTAYNHEKYIRRCLEGFIMQKTNFKLEVLINEDASTDNTAAIIKEFELKYPDIVKPIYQKENQYSKRVGLWRTILFPRAKGKYIALCEGDDYWTDPLKLQKQVDFLEANQNFSCCFHRYQECENGVLKEGLLPDIHDDVLVDKYNFFEQWYTKTLTCVIRKEDYLKIDLSKYERTRDTILFYELLNVKPAMCLDFNGGVYNKHTGGVWSPLDVAQRRRLAIRYLEALYKSHQENKVLEDTLFRKLQKSIKTSSLKQNIALFKSLHLWQLKIRCVRLQAKKYYKNLFHT